MVFHRLFNKQLFQLYNYVREIPCNKSLTWKNNVYEGRCICIILMVCFSDWAVYYWDIIYIVLYTFKVYNVLIWQYLYINMITSIVIKHLYSYKIPCPRKKTQQWWDFRLSLRLSWAFLAPHQSVIGMNHWWWAGRQEVNFQLEMGK